jgi:hypothetical protein
MSSEGRMLTAYNADYIAEWCGGKVVQQHDALDHGVITEGVNVPTPVGVKRAQRGDMVIRQHDGSFVIEKGEQK